MTNNDLINKIKRLEKVEPSELWLKSNRNFIFKYIDLDEASEKKMAAVAEPIFGVATIRDRFNLIFSAFGSFRYGIMAQVAALAVVLVLTGNFVVAKAEKSLPGDRLYTVKTFIEKTQLVLAFNDERRVALNFEFTEKRLNEFSTVVVAQKDGNSVEVKAAAENLKNQLKAASQELNNAKSRSGVEKAVLVAKIADTKTTAYAKKISEVKKEMSDKKQDQVEEVAANIEELRDNAFAMLIEAGDLNTKEISDRIAKEIKTTEETIVAAQKKISTYESDVKIGAAENKVAEYSLIAAEKLVSESSLNLENAKLAFGKKDFSQTRYLLAGANKTIAAANDIFAGIASSEAVPTTAGTNTANTNNTSATVNTDKPAGNSSVPAPESPVAPAPATPSAAPSGTISGTK